MKNPVKFGKYYLLERVNVGGMAEIFKAKSFGEAGFERLVAVKRVLPSIAEDHEFIAMFIDEAKLAVQLTHPNIAQIFELGKVGDAYFIALEYVPGKDLRAIFDRARKRAEPLPIPMACYMVMKLCEGLDYAHNKKDSAGRSLDLVHRDVSPQNILMSYEGDVKLIDFGIAKAASKSSKTQAGILKGKFGYMSPEQVRGLQVDRRSDVFAVGICLYELLTMERLFVGESDFSTLEKVRNVEIMPPSTYNRKVPEELEQIVLKALAKHPEDRYRTAMDLHDDLQSFMYTSGNFFARKDLSGYMHRVFQDEIAKEAVKDDEYRRFDSRRASDLDVFDGAAAPAPGPARANTPPVPPAAAKTRSSVPPPPPPQARTSVPPPPPPPARTNKSTMMGGFGPAPGPAPAGRTASSSPASAAAPPPPPVAVAPPMPSPPSSRPVASAPVAQQMAVAPPPAAPAAAAAPPGLEMEWDDEELATQVYDRPDALQFKPTSSARPAAGMSPNGAMRPAAGSNGNGHHAAKAVAPPPQAAYPSRHPTAPMPAALPSIPPGVGPAVGVVLPPSTGHLASGPHVPPTMAMPQAAIGAPMPPSMGPPAYHQAPGGYPPPPSHGPSGGYSSGTTTGPYSRRADQSHSTEVTPPRRSSRTLVVAALFGTVAVAAAVVVGLKVVGTRDATAIAASPPTGSLAVSTSVAGVTLFVDGQPQSGTGTNFTVTNLPAASTHTVLAQRQGYQSWQQMVPVRANEVTAMRIEMIPEAPAPAPAVAAAPVAPAAPAAPATTVLAAATPTTPSETTTAVGTATAQAAQTPAPPTPAAPVVATAPTPRQAAHAAPTPAVEPEPAPTPAAPPAAPAPPETASNNARTVSRPTPHTPRPERATRNTPSAGTPANTPAAPAAPAGGAGGFLSISTRPASRCTVAGQSFSTPRIRLELPAGTHRVTCTNSEFNVSANFSITIRPGQVTMMPNQPLN